MILTPRGRPVNISKDEFRILIYSINLTHKNPFKHSGGEMKKNLMLFWVVIHKRASSFLAYWIAGLSRAVNSLKGGIVLTPVWNTVSTTEEIQSPYILRASSSEPDPKRVVRAGRRRKAEPPAGGRERAETPQRERESAGGSPPFSGGGSRPVSTGGSGVPLRGPQSIFALILILIVICVFGGMQLFGSGDSEDMIFEQPAFPVEPTEPFEILPLENPTAVPTRPAPVSAETAALPPASPGDQTWLVMLYQDADDKVLEQDIYLDLNEAERVGSSERVQIVAQIDRYRAGYQGDGDWITAKRFVVTQDGDLNRVRSEQVADLGEVNMADAAALVDFVEWAVRTYPATHYALILSDHGLGWPGGWSDAAPSGRGDTRIPLAAGLGDQIFLHELDAALGELRSRTGIEKFDMIGLDACLMGQLEVFTALAPHARVAVASQEVEPALGWAYTSFLTDLTRNPDLSPAQLGERIVQSYISEDQRIQDDQARSELLRQGGGMSGMFGLFGSVTPEMLVRQMSQDGTLAAIDLEAVPELMAALNQFAYSLQNTSQPQVARARAYAQSFTSIFGSKVPPSYIDLGNFAALLSQETNDSDVRNTAETLLASLDRAVIAEKHGPKRPGATGVAIYFPNSDLYRTAEAGARSYTAIADRFSRDSLWDDYMAFHYSGRVFNPQDTLPVMPESGAAIRGPGQGQITLSSINASSGTAAPGDPVLLSVDISGENIGYIYFFTGYLDRAAGSIFVADMDYLESAETRQVGGVPYPDWGEGDFRLEFEWEPVVFAIDDGRQRVTALFKPQSYGATFEEAVYAVDGIYTYADSGDTRPARLYFSDGVLRRVVGFTGSEEAGAPREIIPNPGDQFTILERWMDLDASGRVSQTADQQGGTLTFSTQSFTWVELDAPAGEYVVGFIVEDLDGNNFEAYTQINVR